MVGIPQLLHLHHFFLLSPPHTPVCLLFPPKAEFGSWDPEDKVCKTEGVGDAVLVLAGGAAQQHIIP